MKYLILTLVLLIIIFSCYFIFNNLGLNFNQKYYLKGIDISNQFDGNLNWNEITDYNDFVILRAVRAVDTSKLKGVSKYVSIGDKNFQKNWKALKGFKIVRGAYHFFAPNISAEIQFESYKKIVQLEKGDLPPILDVENRNCNMNEALKWLKLAKEYYKVDPILYSDYLFYKIYLKNLNNRYPTWLYLNENFLMQPSFQDPNCIFWQYKQDKTILNFQEKVDLNVFLGDSNKLHKILIQ